MPRFGSPGANEPPEIPGEQDAEYTRKPVTCDKCGRIWWVNYGDAHRALQAGKMRTASRQVRVGEVDLGLVSNPGTWETEHYLAGLCEVCDFGLVKPPAEIEWLIITRHRDTMLRRGVDPELAFDYARAEYEQDYQATFNPEYAEWNATIGWALAEHPFDIDWSQLPEAFQGLERGLGDGSPKCPHVSNQYGPLPWVRT